MGTSWACSFNLLQSASFAKLVKVSLNFLHFLTFQCCSYLTLRVLQLSHYSSAFIKNLPFFPLTNFLCFYANLLHTTHSKLPLNDLEFVSLTIHCGPLVVVLHLPRRLFLIQSVPVYLGSPFHL